MSTLENTTFLDSKYADFEQADYDTKLQIIRQVQEQGFTKDANELRAEMKEQFLKDRGCTFADVLEDEDGEYILDEMDNGNPGEDGYMVNVYAIRFPKEFMYV